MFQNRKPRPGQLVACVNCKTAYVPEEMVVNELGYLRCLNCEIDINKFMKEFQVRYEQVEQGRIGFSIPAISRRMGKESV